jgi:Flp pilus assembly protein TadG
MRPLAHLRRRTRGQALVEFALVLPIFILLLVGVFDLGRAVYVFSTVNNAAREAVRLAIVDQNCDAIGQKAQQHAASVDVSWSYDGSLTPAAACDATGEDIHIQFLQPDYSGADAFADDCDPGQAAPNGPRSSCVAQVTVEYSYTAATPIIGNILGTITLTGTSQQAVELTYTSP